MWFLDTRKSEPWTFITCLAGFFLVGAAICVGSLKGSPLLVALDLFGDMAALYAISRYAKDPAPSDPEHAPITGGRRKLTISIALLVAIAAVAVVKTITDVVDGGTELWSFCLKAQPIAPPVPHHEVRGILLVCFTIVATVLFYCAYAVGNKPAYADNLDTATKTTLSTNRTTGFVNCIVQFVVVVWVLWGPRLINGFDSRARAILIGAAPLGMSIIGILTTLLMGLYVAYRCSLDVRQQWPLLVGGRAPEVVEKLIHANICGVPGIDFVRRCEVFSIGPRDGLVVLEAVISKKAKIHQIISAVKDIAQDEAATWQKLEGPDVEKRLMHLQVECCSSGQATSDLLHLAGRVGSMITGQESVLPILHFSSGAHRTIDQGEVAQFLGIEQLPNDTLIFDCSVLDKGWQTTHSNQMNKLSNVLKDRKYAARPIAYFGLADIPLTIDVGSRLDSTRSIALYQRDPEFDCWRSLNDAQPREPMRIRFNNEELDSLGKTWLPVYAGPVALKVEISAEIIDQEIREATGCDDLPIVTLRSSYFKKSVVLTATELQEFVSQYRLMIDKIRERFPQNDSIHIFTATPCGPTLEIGRHTSARNYGPIHLYYYDRTKQPKSQCVMILHGNMDTAK